MLTPITARQRELLLWVHSYIEEHTWPPTLREICKGIGVISTNAVHEQLAALERKGYISQARTPKSRSIKILRLPPSSLLDWPEELEIAGSSCKLVQLVGETSALGAAVGSMLEWVRKNPGSTIGRMIRAFGVNYRTAYRWVDRAVAAGQLRRVGRYPSRLWVL